MTALYTIMDQLRGATANMKIGISYETKAGLISINGRIYRDFQTQDTYVIVDVGGTLSVIGIDAIQELVHMR